MNYLTKTYLPCTFFLAYVLAVCTKAEFQPEPIGEAIPYEQTNKKSLAEELSSQGYTRFLSAWERSNLPEKLEEWGDNTVSLLVPSNEAFYQAGYTQEKVNAMSTAELDEMLLYHTLSGTLDTAAFERTLGNITISTKLRIPELLIQDSAHTFQHAIGISDKGFFVNGRASGKMQVIKSREADIIPINRFLEKPTMDMVTFLKQDGRFTIFSAMIEENYTKYASLNYDFLALKKMIGIYDPYGNSLMYIDRHSLFAPTDEAFIKAGYAEIEDFRRLNDPGFAYFESQGGFPYNEYQYGAPYNYFSFMKTDSVLTHHLWGRLFLPDNNEGNATVFFSNQLDSILDNYVLSMEGHYPPALPQMRSFLRFTRTTEGKIQIRLKDARPGNEPATVIEPDILTLNGPIHVVDRLFIPDHF